MNDILRLHTDADGIVWCGMNGVRAVNSKLLPEEFVSRNSFLTAKHVRILGVSDNASLIVKAYDTHKKTHVLQSPTQSALKKTLRLLEVGSATICPIAAIRADPVEVLQRMWQLDTSGRLSAHWKRVDSNMFNSYLLRLSVEESTEKALSIFRYHPLAGSLGFLGSCSLSSCVWWAAEILDPRWFIHSDKPHRITKLTRFLGLTPSNFKLLLSGNTDLLLKQRNGQRAKLTYDCWNTLNTDKVDYSSPHSFLWRINRQHGFGWKGALAASRSFVRFAILHWQDKLSSSSRVFFDPESYFANSEEVEAYSLYANTGQVRG